LTHHFLFSVSLNNIERFFARWQTYVSYFRHYWMTENQVQNEKKDDKSSLAQIASTKGNNDGHILKLIEKRFLKLKKIKEDKRHVAHSFFLFHHSSIFSYLLE